MLRNLIKKFSALRNINLSVSFFLYLLLIFFVVNFLLFYKREICLTGILTSFSILFVSLLFYFLIFKSKMDKMMEITTFSSIETLQNVTEKILNKHRILEMFTQNIISMVDNNAGIGMWIKDQDDKYIYANKFLRDFLFEGKPMHELTGKTDGEILGTKVDYSAFEKMIKTIVPQEYPLIKSSEFFTDGSVCNMTDIITRIRKMPCRFHEELGDSFVLDVWKTPLIDDNGQVVGTVGTFVNVSEENRDKKFLKVKYLEKKGLAFKINGSRNYYLTHYTFGD